MTNQDQKNTQADTSNKTDQQQPQGVPNKDGQKQPNQGEKNEQASQQGGGTPPQNQK